MKRAPHVVLCEQSKPDPIIFGDKSLSDVTLVVEEQEFIAHKMFLASSSDAFKAMFYGEFVDSKQNRITINNVSVDNFRRILEIIYTDKMSDTPCFLQFPFCSRGFLTRKERHYKLTVIDDDDGFTNKKDVRKFFKSSSGTRFIPSYESFFYTFWKDTTEILNIADRFNMTCLVKNYFGIVINNDINRCSREECHQCFNSFFFALINGLDISNYKKTYPRSLCTSWFDYAGKARFPNTFSQDNMKHVILNFVK